METEIKDLQELVLATIPPWHHYFSRPFEQRMLREHMSLGMYYCLQTLRHHRDTLTMTELSRLARAPKQRTTKVVDQLVERGFVERVNDPSDRRVVRLRVTEEGEAYVSRFLREDAGCYGELFERMSEADRAACYDSLSTILRIFEA